jgi:hypothetical protein
MGLCAWLCCSSEFPFLLHCVRNARDVQLCEVQAAVWVGDKFVKGFQMADNALVRAEVLVPVDELQFEKDEHLTPSEVQSYFLLAIHAL